MDNNYILLMEPSKIHLMPNQFKKVKLQSNFDLIQEDSEI